MTMYAMLMTSLPYLSGPFDENSLPISRIQLNKRLTLLRPEHAAILNQIQELVHWDYILVERSDSELVEQAEAAIAAFKGKIKQIVQWRLEFRTIIAALRRRKKGLLPEGKWGYGKWVKHIEMNWKQSDFALGRFFPWIIEANSLLAESQSLALERLILKIVWQYLYIAGQEHYFDFEAVVIYILKWNIMARWKEYNSKNGLMRFDELLHSGLKELDNIINWDNTD